MIPLHNGRANGTTPGRSGGDSSLLGFLRRNTLRNANIMVLILMVSIIFLLGVYVGVHFHTAPLQGHVGINHDIKHGLSGRADLALGREGARATAPPAGLTAAPTGMPTGVPTGVPTDPATEPPASAAAGTPAGRSAGLPAGALPSHTAASVAGGEGVRQEPETPPRGALADAAEPVAPNLPARGVLFDGQHFATTEAREDYEELTIAGWVRLDDRSPVRTLRTVATNKISGCTAAAKGVSLFVNTWETDDGRAVAEWGDGQEGCRSLRSEAGLIKPNRWTHLAVVLGRAAHGGAALFVDGVEVASSAGDARPAGSLSGEALQFGQFPRKGDGDPSYPLFGDLSRVSVHSRALSGAEVRALYAHTAASGQRPSSATRLGESLPHFLPLPGPPAVAKHNARLSDAGDATPVLYRVPPAAAPAPAAGPAGAGGLPSPALEAMQYGFDVSRAVTPSMRAASSLKAADRAQAVREGLRHAWKGYREHAWGKDEVLPKSGRAQDNWGGMAVTMVDTMDTLWLMGLRRDFEEAADWVAKHLSFSRAGTVSVFETVIRELGGLLSAFDLSGDARLLAKAKELGDLLLPAFDTPSGVPVGRLRLGGSHLRLGGGQQAVLAEVGTLQVEFRYLSKATGDAKYARAANRVFDVLGKQRPPNGLFGIHVSTSNALVSGQVTFGALGDSFYEYLLKVWLQGDRTEARYREMYDAAVDGVVRKIWKTSAPSGLSFLADLHGSRTEDKMDHLACFMAGALALGAYTDPRGRDSPRARRDLRMGQALGYTCYQMYKRHATGLSPEYVVFRGARDFQPGPNAKFYILRPETAEALFILHEVTGDPIYRDWSFEIFEAIERHCRTRIAYGAHPDVTSASRTPDDRMESFALAETFKYLYLIQAEDRGGIDLDHYVFNTEAHPMRIWSAVDAAYAPRAL